MENYHTLVKEQLNAGRRISVISVLNSVGTTECRKIVSDLKKEGMSIESEKVISPKGKIHKEYWLDKDVVAA